MNTAQIITSVVQMLLGLAFFLFGMNVMSSDLEKLAGGKLEVLLKKFTKNPILGIIFGALITIAVQSSSAVTVMLVGLVNSGIMQFSQTIFIIFGANIGTTLTAWILSLSGIESDNIAMMMLKPENFSPILAFIGVMFVMFSKNSKRKSLGSVFVGFAVLMYGMEFMGSAMDPIKDIPGIENVFIQFSNPLFGVFIGAVITAVIQSSAASVGMLQALALTGLIDVGMVIPIVMGQNIGTCVTAVISSIGTNSKAKRVAFLHTSLNVIGTVLFTSVFWIVDSAFDIPLFREPATAWSIALIHSIFNVALTVVLCPFAKPLIKLTEICVKDKDAEKKNNIHLFSMDERLLATPSVAVSECDNITVKMAETAKQMIITSFAAMCEYDKETEEWLQLQEEILDAYEDDIGSFLVKVSALSLSEGDSRKTGRMLHAIGNFERLGDHALNLLESGKEMSEKKISFSSQAYDELTVLTDALIEIITLTTKAYAENDAELAARVEPLEQVVDRLTEKVRRRHIDRLKAGECTIELGFILSDILNNCERISDHCSNIAVAVIESATDGYDAHNYLSSVKSGNDAFDEEYRQYKEKYKLQKNA
ncbi:MAG: Na/Pi cotransporter family protein [Clostridia bacterium]|nr:Na/Pi cotransporter family protein [Clostridia bacterium]